MSTDPTQMRLEIEEIPAALERLTAGAPHQMKHAAERIRRMDLCLVTTIARGSSDHAAAYLKYAFEVYAGIPVASLGPSVSSVYGTTLRLENSVSLAISQSGQSPDIVKTAQMSKTGGALAIALTNDVCSPLASACDHAFDIAAGPEKSVAATKTFVNSVATGLLLLAHWKQDEDLLDAMRRLPEQCERAIGCRWDSLMTRMLERDSLYVLGRGPSLAIAGEVALKFKETCQIHAEAYSAAEVMHGPVSIVGKGFPVLVLAGRDASQNAVAGAVQKLAISRPDIFATGEPIPGTTTLSSTKTGHPVTDPLLAIVSFYAFIEELARRRGKNPDIPPNLRKVTETV
ncbi:MAG: SIS domain-containing protein [Hoeflea sp.]|uniref:SIS domain-containing protein n=1 Tax=Hoeflea sp. TaxID=1940281 RepID=UPI003EF995A3